ncbi:MAG: hypothetical protein ACPLRS_01685, partial [Hydrogenobacter sp.]
SEVLSKLLVLSYLPNSGINREEAFRYLKLIGDALIVLSLEEVTKTLNLPQKDRKDVRLTLEYAIKSLDKAYEYLKSTEEQIIQVLEFLFKRYMPIEILREEKGNNSERKDVHFMDK